MGAVSASVFRVRIGQGVDSRRWYADMAGQEFEVTAERVRVAGSHEDDHRPVFYVIASGEFQGECLGPRDCETISEVQFSPYNAPFIPADAAPGVIWVGAEYRDMPHSAHVYEYFREQGRRHVAELLAQQALLPYLDELAGEGIQAAARRAVSIRRVLSPSRSKTLPRNLPAKVAPRISMGWK